MGWCTCALAVGQASYRGWRQRWLTLGCACLCLCVVRTRLVYLQDEYPALMAALLGIPSSRIVGLGVSAVASGRRLINDAALMELHPSVAR